MPLPISHLKFKAMKKRLATIIAFLFLSFVVIMGFTHINEAKFYYAYNEKIYLNEHDNKLIVRYVENKKSDKERISLYSELEDHVIEWKDDSTCIITFSANEKRLYQAKIQRQTDVKSCNPVYKITTGLELGFTDEFLVKFNDNVPQNEIQKLHKKHKVEVVKITELYQLIKVQVGSNALEIANSYQESGLTRFSHPNFICEMELHQHQVIPNDPYFTYQFSLHNTGQLLADGHSGTIDADIDAPEAWSITKGSSNIIIAVLDQGVTSNHPDLPNSRQVRLKGSNFAGGDPNNPSPTGNDNHGNACAGIIAATQNNNEGITGIAPNCKIMPIRIFKSDGTGITPEKLADAITFAHENGAHIISNSWGYNSDNPNLYPVIKDAIIEATTQGRNGLGCIVVFSAGNNIVNNGFVHFPSNVNVSGVLTVGASDRYDLKAYYSPLGNPSSSNNQLIDIVAPSHRAYSCQIATETFEAWSIDIPGNAGYNPFHENDCGLLPGVNTFCPDAGVNYLSYTGRFGGTSYSCPQVAAVAALILSVNPNLSQQQVFDILTSTTDKVGGYAYVNGFCNELGYGRLNAYKAVFKALVSTISITGPSTVCSSNTIFTLNNLPSSASVTWSHSSNLLYVSGQGTASYTVKAASPNISGSGWITAQVVHGSCSFTLPSKNIWAGIPVTPTDIIPFWNNGMEFGNDSYYDFRVTPHPSSTYYTWQVDGGTIISGQGTNWITVKTIKIPANVQAQFGVAVKAGNNCGESVWLTRTGWVVPGTGATRMLLSPNPTSGETFITIESNTTETTFNENTLWDLEVYSGSNLLQTKQTGLRGRNARIQTAGWKEGVYLVRIIYQDGVLTGKLIVE